MINYNEYVEQINQHNRGIFMCVSRGKLSEGMSFKDNLARAVFVVGIPYLLVNDSRVNLKK
jgi:Rad3-related DNA helicase